MGNWAGYAWLGVVAPILVAPGPNSNDFAERWAWALRVLPQLAEYEALDLIPNRLAELLAWAPAGQATTVFVPHEGRCRSVRVSQEEGQLAGELVERRTFSKGEKTVHVMTVVLDQTMTFLGPGWTTYKRRPSGKWQEVGGGGCGCMEAPAGVLSRVTSRAAWYAGAVVRLRAVCAGSLEITQSCVGGAQRVCSSCQRIRLDVQSQTHGFGFGHAGSNGPSAVTVTGPDGAPPPPVDCSRPCPTDDLVALIEQLNAVLSGRDFLWEGPRVGAPVAFRTRKACERHLVRLRP